jgi:hypothetical protein
MRTPIISCTFREINGVPKGIRTPVVAVKGRCPRPLDDGDSNSSGILIQHFKNVRALICKLSEMVKVSRYNKMKFLDKPYKKE